MDATTTEILIIDDSDADSKLLKQTDPARISFLNEILVFLLRYGVQNEKIVVDKSSDLVKVIKTSVVSPAVKLLLSPASALKSANKGNEKSEDEEEDFDESIKVAFALLFKIIASNEYASVVSDICNAILAEQSKLSTDLGDEKFAISSRVIDILSNLYTCLPVNSPSRYDAFITLVRYATITNQTSVLGVGADDQEKIQQTFSQWNGATAAQYQELLLALSQAMKNDIDSNKFIVYYLKSFKQGDEINENVLTHARKVVLAAIKNPLFLSKENTNLLRLEPIQKMASASSNDKDKRLIKLLSIFSSETLETYQQFEQQNAGFVQELGLDPKICTENMRLLTLISLAGECDTLSYSQIASKLKVEGTRSVEQWVVKAITLKLIDAKMDQVNETVIIYKAIQRVFTDDQWSVLEKKLNQWKTGIKGILQTLQTTHDSHHGGKKFDRSRGAGDKRKEHGGKATQQKN